MTSFQKFYDFTDRLITNVIEKSSSAMSQFVNEIDCLQIENFGDINHENNIEQPKIQQKQQKFQGLEQLQLLQSRAVPNQQIGSITDKQKKRRIKLIQEQKKRIAEQLRQLDQQIQQIKGKSQQQKPFKKYQKIHKDENAQKHAQQLVKQLKNQKKQIQIRKRQQFQKSLIQMQKEDEERRRIRQQEVERKKQQRKLAIIQRMQQQKKRKQQRRLIQAQSNQLIAKLKKQQQLQKVASLVPSQIVQIDHKRRALQKKNNFNLEEIQQHDRKYRELKIRTKREKQQRAHSLKVPRQHSNKYSKNIWIERIQEQQIRKKQEQKLIQQRKRQQLQKRLKYGQLVKNIFLPKKKDKENDSGSIHHKQVPKQQEQEEQKIQTKPRTPQELPTIQKIKVPKNRTQNSKMYREQSLPGIKNHKRNEEEKIKQFDPQQQQKQKIKKIRELQLRKQTKQRLKKLQNQGLNKAQSQQERFKYKNYLGEVKVKKDEANQWKKIINNQRLTQQQKYQEVIKKAGNLQARARIRQDRNNKQADQDTVNLYIGSIQAKLALLEKF